ncbi:OmpA/MotB domain protein [endosymbiont of Tevnia jerichonana (vent Tica)]|uniref:OmpA/MotB domain protein n=2 Tax=Gammaproteobacteria TaxID=1236 RepID=G2FBV4_9GAMM|nr:OmpA/MotB domain protein [endosymbiont of Tevnia jerichonana (vent Tica)]
MKMKLIAATVLALSTSLSAQAQEGSLDLRDDGIETLKQPAIGMLLGGILAGPPGIVVGAVGGALVADIGRRDAELQASREALGEAQRQLQQVSGARSRDLAALERIRGEQHQRLQAVADGFSFCLRFRTDSSELEPRLQPQLDTLAGLLKAFPQLDIEVRASSDRRGSPSYNQQLAQLRAESVVQRLLAAGVDAERIRQQPQGETLAAYAENDLDGMAFDRFVLLSFVDRAAQ